MTLSLVFYFNYNNKQHAYNLKLTYLTTIVIFTYRFSLVCSHNKHYTTGMRSVKYGVPNDRGLLFITKYN